MSMGRYLCQLCYNIVHYGERHPCSFYKDDDEVYTVPPPNEPEEMESMDEKSKETRTGSSNGNDGNIFATTGPKDKEESLPVENNEQISTTSASKRKRSYSALFSPTFLRGMKNSTSDSKSASPTCTERDGNRTKARRSKDPRKMTSATPQVSQIDDSSSSQIPINSFVADAEAASVPGPSGIQSWPHRKGKERRFVCDVCGNDFLTKENLNAHMRTHTGEKPFVCHECGNAFTQKGTLTRHLRIHSGKKLFECDICGKAFLEKGTLTRHLRIHSGKKPFECDICGKGFVQKVNLVTHFRTHSGEKPFKCPFCGKDYANQSSCSNHQKRKHGRK